ncbi:hypothetical protein [Micromonospora chersina]|uniref:hypothetical protein n=1 Tax=Micromonospora chersina TaxID=47854 RepID=UPI0037160BE6
MITIDRLVNRLQMAEKYLGVETPHPQPVPALTGGSRVAARAPMPGVDPAT